jgi:hypothetical protein
MGLNLAKGFSIIEPRTSMTPEIECYRKYVFVTIGYNAYSDRAHYGRENSRMKVTATETFSDRDSAL